MKNVIAFLMMSILLLGCQRVSENVNNSSSNVNNKNLPDTFGAELYNGSYLVYGEDDAELYSLYFMSKIDIPLDSMVKLQYEGGSFEYSAEILKVEEKNINEYILYIIKLNISNFNFDGDTFDISNILIYYDNENSDKYIDLKLQKFRISCVEGNIGNMDLYFRNAPIVIPHDMKQIPYQMTAEKKLIISDVIVSNDEFYIENVDVYKNTMVDIGDNDIGLAFSVSNNELSKYTQYGTTIAIKYIVDEVEYVVMPPSSVLTYNPATLYENNFEKYYNEVLMK